MVVGTAVTEGDTKVAEHVVISHESWRSGSFLSQTLSEYRVRRGTVESLRITAAGTAPI